MKHVMTASLSVALFVSVACTSRDDPPVETASTSVQPEVHVLAEGDCPHYDCAGPLEPGQYSATYFDPTIAFEIGSPGWTWRYTGNFQMLATDASAEGYDADVINFFLDPVISSQGCEDGAEPGVGRSVDELVAWLETAPGLTTSDRTPVTVGGLEGMRLDLELDPTWDGTCFFSEGKPVVPLVYSSAFPGGYNWSIWPRMSMRWYVLGAGNRVLIVDIEDNPKGLSRDELFRSGDEIVETFVFSSPS
jgi:hypothetical protein